MGNSEVHVKQQSGTDLNLDFDASRWQRVMESHRGWWDGSSSKPLINLAIEGRDPGRPEPALPAHEFTSYYDLSVPAETIVDRWLYDLQCKRFLGDAFPLATPNFGPGSIAAFMGLELTNGADTVWFHPKTMCELSEVKFEFDPHNVWFRRLCDLYQAAADRFGAAVQLGMTDIGGNLDILVSYRPGENLLMDLYDCPEVVEQKTWDVHAMWWRYFEELNKIIQRGHPGYSAWTPFYSEKPYYILQCDFGFMIGAEMFDRFAKPELEAMCRKLGNPFFHLDGPGMLTHLDSLLAIPELKGIQWVPGAGQPDLVEWIDVFKKIRQAGKRIQFFTSQSKSGWRALDIIAGHLGSAEGLMMCGSAPKGDEAEVREMLKRYGVG